MEEDERKILFLIGEIIRIYILLNLPKFKESRESKVTNPFVRCRRPNFSFSVRYTSTIVAAKVIKW